MILDTITCVLDSKSSECLSIFNLTSIQTLQYSFVLLLHEIVIFNSRLRFFENQFHPKICFMANGIFKKLIALKNLHFG